MVFIMRFIMIKTDLIELQKVFHQCNEFIRSIWVHTEGEDMGRYDILKREVKELSDKTNAMILILDAYEQNKKGEL